MNPPATIGISISESEDSGRLGLGTVHLQDALVETARYLLSKGYGLAYAGDLNKSDGFNFTSLLFELGMTYGNRQKKIVNYSAFPMYTRLSLEDEAKLSGVASIQRVNPSPEFDKWTSVRYSTAGVEDKKYLDDLFQLSSSESKSIWSQSLTAARRKMNENIRCRIVIGGRMTGYKGVMPGTIEEIKLSSEMGVPVIIDTRWGGAASAAVGMISGKMPNIYNIDFGKENSLSAQINNPIVMVGDFSGLEELYSLFSSIN